MKKSYSEQLKDPRWQRKRLTILERDGWACRKCGDDKTELHVHHTYYAKGKKPWEYPDSDLQTLCKNCHSNTHEPKGFKFYLAGKISKNGWRNDIVDGLRDFNFAEDGLIYEKSIRGRHSYTGPFFVSCDHGCLHAPTLHGSVGAGGCDGSRRHEVFNRAMSGIRDCDVLFAWIDSLDCYGTLIEIGYASALKKPVFIAFKKELDISELWFSKFAALVFWDEFDNASDAFNHFIPDMEAVL